jgi:two-component system invasion response regulator UvrY
VRFLIADDHPIFRLGVGQLVARAWPGAEVVEAGTLADALAAVGAGPFDAIVLDLVLPDVTGHEGAVRMLEAAGSTPVLVVSFSEESKSAARLLQLGVAGYLQKDRAGEELVVALGRLLEGKRYVTESMADLLVDLLGGKGTTALPHEALSAQEHRVLLLIASGHPPAEISRRLGISARTVGTYRTRIFEKTGWRSTVQMVAYCVTHGLVEPS